MKWIAAIFILLSALSVRANDASLNWTPSTDTNVVGYKVYFWATNVVEGGYTTNCIDVGNVTSYTVTGLDANTIYSFAVKCYDAVHEYSEFSNIVSHTTPVRLSLGTYPCLNVPGIWSSNLALPLTNWQPTNFCILFPVAPGQSGFIRFASDPMLPRLNPQLGITNLQP